MFANLRRITSPAVVFLSLFAGLAAHGQDRYYNENIPVGTSGTLSYQLEVENGACGGNQQLVADDWTGFTFTPTGGSGVGMNPEVDYVYPCALTISTVAGTINRTATVIPATHSIRCFRQP